MFIEGMFLYRPITSNDTDVLLPRKAIVEMYRDEKKSDRYLPNEQEQISLYYDDDYMVFGGEAPPPRYPRVRTQLAGGQVLPSC